MRDEVEIEGRVYERSAVRPGMRSSPAM